MRKLLIALCLFSLPVVAADMYSFDLLPSGGVISGAPGSTIGWGYSIHNDSSNLWLVTASLNASTFSNATPTSLFDFPDVAPGSTVAVPFDAVSGTGLFQIAWDLSAPAGLVDVGTFDLSAQWWSGDPLAGGSFVSDAASLGAAYSASVSTSAVPEPSGFAALGLLLLGLLYLTNRRVRRPTAHVILKMKADRLNIFGRAAILANYAVRRAIVPGAFTVLSAIQYLRIQSILRATSA